ncbi:translation elongation factor Ts [Candidatus Nomurabacteria bacterium]|nr:translation elongation factor Ts [Candidatus Nomurabacteria bacterium]
MTTQITTELIKELRDATSVSVMQCKKALEEAEGDMEKAKMILKNKSRDAAEKKADRNASEGIIVVANGSGKTVLLTLHCETDFVARNEEFIKIANELAMIALNDGIDAMNAKSAEIIGQIIQKIGEKIELGKVEVIEGDVIGSYVHSGKKAVVVVLAGGTAELAKDIAMHIAAMNPSYTTRNEIDADTQAKAKEIFMKELEGSDKPQEIKDKILNGKIDTFFKEQTLVDQSFIKNPDMTVGALLTQSKASINKFIKESIG